MPRNPDVTDPYQFRYPQTSPARIWLNNHFREGRRDLYRMPMSSCPGGYAGNDFVFHRNFGKFMRQGSSYYDVPFSTITNIDEFTISSGNWEWGQTGLRCTSSEGCLVTEAEFDFQRKAFCFYTGPGYVDLGNWTELLFNYKDEEDYQAVRFTGITELGDVSSSTYSLATVGVQIPFLQIDFVKMEGGTRTVERTHKFRCYDNFNNLIVKSGFLYSHNCIGGALGFVYDREAWPLGVHVNFQQNGFWRVTAIVDRLYGTDGASYTGSEHPWHGGGPYYIGPDEEFQSNAPGVNIGPDRGFVGSSFNVHRATYFSDYFSTGKKIGVRVGGTGTYTPSANHTLQTIVDPSRTYAERIKGVQWLSMQRGFFSANEDNEILLPRIEKFAVVKYTPATPSFGSTYAPASPDSFDPYMVAEEWGPLETNNRYVLPNSDPDSYQLEILSGAANASSPSAVGCTSCNDFNGATFILTRPNYSRPGGSAPNYICNPSKYYFFTGGMNTMPCMSTVVPTHLPGSGYATTEIGFGGIEFYFDDSIGGGAPSMILGFMKRRLNNVTNKIFPFGLVGVHEAKLEPTYTGKDLKPWSDAIAAGYDPATKNFAAIDGGRWISHDGVSIRISYSDATTPDEVYDATVMAGITFDTPEYIDAGRVWETPTDEVSRITFPGTFDKVCDFAAVQFRLTPLPAAIPHPDPHPAQDENHDQP